jgi:hypothetical protein
VSIRVVKESRLEMISGCGDNKNWTECTLLLETNKCSETIRSLIVTDMTTRILVIRIRTRESIFKFNRI